MPTIFKQPENNALNVKKKYIQWEPQVRQAIQRALDRTIQFFQEHPDRWIQQAMQKKGKNGRWCFCATGRFGLELSREKVVTFQPVSVLSLLCERAYERRGNKPIKARKKEEVERIAQYVRDLKHGRPMSINDMDCKKVEEVVDFLQELRRVA
jgi:hypothetical protein